MALKQQNLFIDQGTDFSYTIPLFDDANNALITSNVVASSMLRKSYLSTNAFSFTVNVVNSSLILTLTSAQSSNIAYGRYVYDAVLHDPIANTTIRAVEGVVTIRASATH